MSPSSTSSSDRRLALRFAARTGVFLLGCLVICAVLNPLHRELLFLRDTPHVLERTLTSRLPDAPRFLFAGDSHVGCGFDPDAVEDAFNFASNGESLVQTAGKLGHYLDSGGRPGVVVLPLDPHGFSGFRANRVRDYRYWSMRIDLWELARVSGDNEHIRMGLWGRWFHWIGRGHNVLRDAVRAALNGQRITPRGGFTPKPPHIARATIDRRDEMVRERLERHYTAEDLDSDILANAFRDAVTACAEAGVPIVLVKMPVSRPYLDAIPEASLDATAREEAWAQSSGLVAAILDHREWRADDLEAFCDADHLAEDAARDFTQLVADEIEQVLEPR